jgi:orotidine-5'-phosphate decarboxylase
LTFNESLRASIRDRGSNVCVGLDPDLEALPAEFEVDPDEVLRFVTGVVEATSEFAAAYKPNSAFYEIMGPHGMEVLQAVIASVPEEIPVILDVKRGDIGNTAERYAEAAYETYGAGAATVSPYMGRDSLEPFLRRPERGVFVLCRTSNAGSSELQELPVDGTPLFLRVAELANQWNTNDNVGLVAGATFPPDIERIRAVCPSLPILVPGVGAQQGDLVGAVGAAAGEGREGAFLISSSRSIMHASRGPDHQHAAADAARRLRDQIQAAL